MKTKIETSVIDQIEDGEVIFIDAGKSLFEFAKQLTNRNIRIFTNNELLRQLNFREVIFFDGKLNPETNAIASEETIFQIKQTCFDRSFLGFSSIKNNTLNTSTEIEVTLKQTVMNVSDEVYAVGSKLKTFDGKEFKYASLSEVKLINI